MIATRRLYGILAGLAVVGLAAAFSPFVLPIWAGLVAATALAAAIDTWVLWRSSLPEIRRDSPDSVALGVWTDVSLTVENTTDRPWSIEVFDKPPGDFQIEGLPNRGELPAGRRLQFDYRMKATERGAHAFAPADLRVTGPLGLVCDQAEGGDRREFRVYPNFKAVARYALLAVADRAGSMGIRQVRRRGQGMEFSHLREYREGDLSRQIDWKATARHQKLIAREYEDERNQHLVFMLDCGRRMRASEGQLSHFDHSLNASLLLSHVALDQGDSVAVSTFGGNDLWIPRQKGQDGMNTILNRLYDLQPTTAPSDFSRAARRLATHQRRRSLVVMLTNLYDQLTEELLDAIDLLRQRHVVLVASLRERAADELVDRPIDGFDDAVATAAGHAYRRQRDRTHDVLTSRGVMLLDTIPENLSVELVNRYIEIKREGQL
jgi:uncharacterized protein (DUF58 family)